MTEAKSYQQMRTEFFENYRKIIVPALKRHELKRKSLLVFAVILVIICSIPGFYTIFVLFNNPHLDYEQKLDMVQYIVAFFGLGWLLWQTIKKSFEDGVKPSIMPVVCRCFGDLEWSQDIFYSEDFVQDSCLIPDFDKSKYDDIFEGSFKDVSIEIAEGSYTKGHGKNRTTVFDGVIIKLDMNKDFDGHTIIRPDSIFHGSPASYLEHTTLEDVVFEKKFDVFTNNEVEARYLITTSFMERLNKMQTAFKANDISCAFYDRWLLIAISTSKDLFSICSLVKPLEDSGQFFQMYEEIVSIIKLIDYFKLDQKIGL